MGEQGRVTREMVERVAAWAVGEKQTRAQNYDVIALCSLADAVLDAADEFERVADYLVEIADEHDQRPDATIRLDAAALRRVLALIGTPVNKPRNQRRTP